MAIYSRPGGDEDGRTSYVEVVGWYDPDGRFSFGRWTAAGPTQGPEAQLVEVEVLKVKAQEFVDDLHKQLTEKQDEIVKLLTEIRDALRPKVDPAATRS